jgi:hypothetical protein
VFAGCELAEPLMKVTVFFLLFPFSHFKKQQFLSGGPSPDHPSTGFSLEAPEP